ncbi:hypothetical protein ACFY0G_40415 [Streptomyces sp. NPDC001552]|uniref:hypothetical protein n=1 Tax=Streptomyces sp. NPDC001552 TaxID=3364587 RepID=UPI0036CE1956
MTDAAVQKITREYLPRGGGVLREGEAAFVSFDLVHGVLKVAFTDEYAKIPPVLVGIGWNMRWPIPPVSDDRANAFLDDLAEHVENLQRQSAIRVEPDPPGVILYAGAGTSIDAIQRKCAALWSETLRLSG